MGIISKMIVDSFKSPDKVMEKEMNRLTQEAAKLGLEPDIKIIEIGDSVTGKESAIESLRAAIYAGNLRPDKALVADIPTEYGNVSCIVPVSGKNVLAAEFAGEINGTVPATVALKRGMTGSWGTGKWITADENENNNADKLISALKDNYSIASAINWDKELGGDYIVKLDWGLQIIPSGSGKTTVFMQTGPIGILKKKHGLDSFINILTMIKEITESFSTDDFNNAGVPVNNRKADPSVFGMLTPLF